VKNLGRARPIHARDVRGGNRCGLLVERGIAVVGELTSAAHEVTRVVQETRAELDDGFALHGVP
jgi:hypothetical protein